MGDYSTIDHSSKVNPRRNDDVTKRKIGLLEQRFFSSKQAPIHNNDIASDSATNMHLTQQQSNNISNQQQRTPLDQHTANVVSNNANNNSSSSNNVVDNINQTNNNTYHLQQQQQQHHLHHHHHASMVAQQQQQQQQLQVNQTHQQVNQLQQAQPTTQQQQQTPQQPQQQPQPQQQKQQQQELSQSIVNHHSTKISLDMATQTELDMSKLKEQDTRSAAKDSKLEDLQQSKDDLDREMLTQQKLITKQKDQLAKCLDMTKQLLIDKSQLEKKAARQRCMQNRLRLGQFVTQRHGASFVENWSDGYAFIELMKKQEAVTHEKEEIDKQRKLLSKRRPSTSNAKPRIINQSNNSNSPSSIMTDSGASTASGSSLGFANASSNNNIANSDHKSSSLMANGAEFAKPEIPKDFANRHKELDYYEQEEILKLRHVALRKEDAELQLEFEKLERERNLHIRELKRIHNEDQSRFNNHQILHDRYLLLTLLGKGGFCKYSCSYLHIIYFLILIILTHFHLIQLQTL